jgi:Uma2 family endonuclease
MALPQENARYTYEDWLAWDEDPRFELIDGEPCMMAPPSRRHQQISFEIGRQLGNFLKGKPCQAYSAPFGVRLSKTEDTVLEPDITVVCDPSKLDDRGCSGAPDLIVEVLSPSSARHDRMVKFNKYQGAGVREYWIVDPETKTVQVCILRGSYYGVTMYADTDTAPVGVLPGCGISLPDVFEEL